jgi:hypothetical protein
MKITKRQLRRIIKEEKAKVLAEQKIRRTVRRKLMEQAGGHMVNGNHEGQEFSVQVPDDLASSLFSAHAALLATSSNPDDISYADSGSPQAETFVGAVTQVFDYIDDVVGEQTGKPIGPYGINGEYHQDGSQMSDVLDDAGNFL